MTVDFNRLNKDTYYVHITADGEVEEYKTDSGEIFKMYWYELPTYNKNGEEKTLKFSAHKNLRRCLFKALREKETEVTSFDEVKFHELPKKYRIK